MRGIQFSINDFKRHPWLHILSISTIGASLLVIALFFLFYRNFSEAASSAEPKLTGTAYLKEAILPSEIDELRNKILFLEGVQSATYRGKGSVLKDLGEFVGAPQMDDLSTQNLFPDIIEITVARDIKKETLDRISDSLMTFPAIVDLDFSQDVVAQYAKVKRALTIIGSVLLVGLLIGCGFIIANFMGMRHQARRREIQIISYVGASQTFVLMPFIWESVIEGFIGAFGAILGVYFVKTLLVVFAPNWLTSVGLSEWAFLTPIQIAGLFGLGIGMAFVGSITVFFRLQET